MDKAKNPIQSVDRSIEILEEIRAHNSPTLTELNEKLDVSKGTIHNHIKTLEQNEFITSSGREYHLGMRFFEWGEDVRQQKDVYQIGKPEADKFAKETGELVSIVTEENGKGVWLYKAGGEDAIAIDSNTGTRLPMHHTAACKAILAFLDRDRIESILDTYGLPKSTENTITDREAMHDELQQIRERGAAFNYEERAEGTRGVAVPIITSDEVIHGSLSIGGPVGRLNGQWFKEDIVEMLENTANIISVNINYS